jgi:hypothetical protein
MQGVTNLLQQLNVSMATVLSKKSVVDLLVRAHVVNGTGLYVGSMLRYGPPLQFKTLAGSFINVTTDLSMCVRPYTLVHVCIRWSPVCVRACSGCGS